MMQTSIIQNKNSEEDMRTLKHTGTSMKRMQTRCENPRKFTSEKFIATLRDPMENSETRWDDMEICESVK